uniref:thromboxane A2 receptor-like n=1 Tax=Styela clava TaxID=7725 RepID=UPI0019393CC9|nr:thromboxane A2 receptor-like [Styela clava]
MHGLQIDDMNISEFSDTIDNGRSDALYSGNYSKKTLAIPCLTFGLGVIGNCLAIAALLRYKYRKQRPPTDTPTTIHKTPPPNLRKNRSTGNISTRDCRKSCSLGSKFDFNILKPIKRRGRRNDFGAFHTLVLALIVVDLAGILVTSPVTMYLYSTNQGIKEAGGESLCNYSAFAMMFFGIVTMASLTGMAIERVLSIQYPYFYKRAVKPKLANIAILIVLLSSALFSALPSMGFGAVRSMYPNTWCFADWQATEQKDMAFNYIYATIGIALILTTILCNECGRRFVENEKNKGTEEVMGHGNTNDNSTYCDDVYIYHMLVTSHGSNYCQSTFTRDKRRT